MVYPLVVFVVLNILIVINFAVMAGMDKFKEKIHILAWALLVNLRVNLLFMLGLGRGLPRAIPTTILALDVMTYLTSRLIRKVYTFSRDIWFVFCNIVAIAIRGLVLWYD